MTPATTRSVLVASCHPDHVVALFHQSIVRLLIADRAPGRFLISDVISAISSPRIASTRNYLVAAFLCHEAKPEWLLMLDADMAFPDDLVVKLLDAADPQERPIVSGLYFGGMPGGKQRAHAYVFSQKETGAPSFDPIEGIGAPGEWGPVGRVHAVGAGCLLMHRDALYHIGKEFKDTGYPWFVEGAGGGAEYGEDISFCLRAGNLGIPIHVHTGVICGHVKMGVVDESTYLAYLGDRAAIGDDGVEAAYQERLRVPTVIHHEVDELPEPKAVDKLILPDSINNGGLQLP